MVEQWQRSQVLVTLGHLLLVASQPGVCELAGVFPFVQDPGSQ